MGKKRNQYKVLVRKTEGDHTARKTKVLIVDLGLEVEERILLLVFSTGELACFLG
jgi:hypothetical protein